MSIAEILRGKGHHVAKVRTTDTVQATLRVLTDEGIGAVVVEDTWMRLAGLFSERDFARAAAEHGASVLTMPVEQFMSAPVLTCRPEDRIEAVMATMTLARVRHLPVLEGSQLVGIVSIGDLVKSRLDEKALEANVLLDIARMHA